jgi:hypothetical protein
MPKFLFHTVTIIVKTPYRIKAETVEHAINEALDEPPCNWEPWIVGAANVTSSKTEQAARDETKDIAVMYDDDADDGRYLAVEPDNTIHMFPDEDSACKFQRDWRRAHGLHPITGEPT